MRRSNRKDYSNRVYEQYTGIAIAISVLGMLISQFLPSPIAATSDISHTSQPSGKDVTHA
ncbi:hypothetical protein DYY67_2337 [Candidatus Nitrosotalea sp. TS]|nr:hypothetical protein [Candidatus Nitrosotalea sp. TS]